MQVAQPDETATGQKSASPSWVYRFENFRTEFEFSRISSNSTKLLIMNDYRNSQSCFDDSSFIQDFPGSAMLRHDFAQANDGGWMKLCTKQGRDANATTAASVD